MTRRRELVAGGALTLAGVAAWAVVRTYPTYDSYFALVWGRELMRGELPAYRVDSAPTPHPLWTLVAGLCSLLGRAGERALVLVAVVSFAALVWGVARLGTAVFDGPRGLLAAVLVGTSFAFGLYAANAYVDVSFVALVTWAAALEQERPRRGALVMALLALAGLLRPEAWLLGFAYLAWQWRRGAATPVLALLAVAPPLLWGLSDLVVTGDALFSLHRTSRVAHTVGQSVSVGGVPKALISYLGSTVRAPVLALGAAGAALALALRGWRSLIIPLALLLVGSAAFVVVGVFVGTAEQRYLTVPAVATCLFAAYSVLGFRDLPAREARRERWRNGAAAAAAVAVVVAGVLFPGQASRLRAELRFIRDSHDQLDALLFNPRVRPCRPIVFPTYRLVPVGRWVLDLPPGRVVAALALKGAPGVRIYVGPGDKAIRRFGIAAGTPYSTNAPDPRLPVVARVGPFTGRGGCGA
jgi:MFS family permease